MLGFRLLLAAVAAACVASPVHAQICTPFNDVLASDPFCSNIQWMYNRGVTLGCPAPPGQKWYCSAGSVRRDQMAAFIFRLANDVVFQDGGNAFGNVAVLGTTDNNALDIRVDNARAMRYEPGYSPNVIGGSAANLVDSGVYGATIGGGGDPTQPNRVTGIYGTVAGGSNTLATFMASVGGGRSNFATGYYSTVPGGFSNVASGSVSFAAGSYARADGEDCAVFSLWGSSPGMPCFGVAGGFNVGAPGGYAFDFGNKRADGGGTRWIAFGRFPGQAISTQTGGFLSDPGGVWVDGSSSREAKDDFAPVDTAAILDKVASLPITTWRYRGGEVRHIGPMAEDFSAAFEVGYGPHTIANLDARGVALAAIQGLNAKLESALREKTAEIAALRAELADIREMLARGASVPR